MSKKKSLLEKLIAALSSLALIGGCAYIFFTGITILNSAAIIVPVLIIAAPVVIQAKSIIEILTGIVEAFVEGIMLIFEGIANLFNF